MPATWSRSLRSRPAWGRVSTALTGEVINLHGEQNGSVDQQVPLDRSDIALVSPLTEHRAGVLEGFLDCKLGDHNPHLHLRHTAESEGPGQRLWSSPRALGFHGSFCGATPLRIGKDVRTARHRLEAKADAAR